MSQQSQIEKKAEPICFLPLCYYQKHCGKEEQKETARELKVNNNQKKYPKLGKAATHTSSMTELTRKKINNKKKHDADEDDQGDSGWVGR